MRDGTSQYSSPAKLEQAGKLSGQSQLIVTEASSTSRTDWFYCVKFSAYGGVGPIRPFMFKQCFVQFLGFMMMSVFARLFEDTILSPY